MLNFEVHKKDNSIIICTTLEELTKIDKEEVEVIVDNIYFDGRYIGSVDYEYDEIFEIF